ncbi:prevent-host-death protein [Nonomuraea sp. NPDC050022]|uniref:prevent-host-death protein n=1 Tax=unclassified Nonomuraea TaxID=2593643 RepID=UPI0033D64694
MTDLEESKRQPQKAEQRFSEAVRRAHDEGPRIVTRRGQDVDVEEYRRLKGEQPGFKEFPLSGPDLSALDLTRDKSSMTRDVDLEGIERPTFSTPPGRSWPLG